MNVTREVESRPQAPGQEPAAGESEELSHRLALLRADVSAGRIEQARTAVKELVARWPDAERVRYWSRVLAPPIACTTPGPDPRSRPLERERAWLREHAREYPGCWLAVYEDRLLAADPNLEVVLTRANETLEGQHALLYQQPGRPQPS